MINLLQVLGAVGLGLLAITMIFLAVMANHPNSDYRWDNPEVEGVKLPIFIPTVMATMIVALLISVAIFSFKTLLTLFGILMMLLLCFLFVRGVVLGIHILMAVWLTNEKLRNWIKR